MTPAEILSACARLQISKGKDYTSKPHINQFENFERAAIIAMMFEHDIDKIFATLIGVKLARLSVLLSTGGEPNHESIEDTFVDATNYMSLWGGFRCRK